MSNFLLYVEENFWRLIRENMKKFEMSTTLVRSCRSAAVISSFKDPPHLLQKAVQSFRAALATGLLLLPCSISDFSLQ